VTLAKGGKAKGAFVVTLQLGDVTTVDSKAPFRCAVNVEADVADDLNLTNAPDDAVNPENNSTAAELEVIDLNDLP
jgi:hypothetical protein